MVESGGLARPGGSACGGKTLQIYMVKGFVYVLRCSDNRLYIGSTRDINKRIIAHENGRVKTTKGRRPVRLIYSEELTNYSEARIRESYLKNGAGRDWLKMKLERCQSG